MTSGTRLLHLFRHSLRSGDIHPLLHLLMRYRGATPGTPPAAPPVPPVPAPVTANLPALPRDVVQRRVVALPALPQAAARALQTLQREDGTLQEIADHIGCDASLTAQVLHLANSPFYGVAGRVASLQDAVQLLGRRALNSLVALSVLSGQFGSSRSRLFDATAFWRHTLASAVAARGLARSAGLAEDTAFVAALLHNLGLLAMSEHFPEALDAGLRLARERDLPLYAVERELGLTPHAEVGRWIAAHWHFPDEVMQAIGHHHAPGGDLPRVADCVHVAHAMAHALDVAGLPHELVPTLDPGAWARVAPDDERLLAVLEEAESGVRVLGEHFRLDPVTDHCCQP